MGSLIVLLLAATGILIGVASLRRKRLIGDPTGMPSRAALRAILVVLVALAAILLFFLLQSRAR